MTERRILDTERHDPEFVADERILLEHELTEREARALGLIK